MFDFLIHRILGRYITIPFINSTTNLIVDGPLLLSFINTMSMNIRSSKVYIIASFYKKSNPSVTIKPIFVKDRAEIVKRVQSFEFSFVGGILV